MTKKERVFGTVRRQHIDYLPSQITLADRTRDKELHAALKLPAAQTMDEYLENHIIISLVKQDYPLFYRNDTKLMKELEKEGYYKVDEPGKVVYDSWGMGVRVGEDGFSIGALHFLQGHPPADVQNLVWVGSCGHG